MLITSLVTVAFKPFFQDNKLLTTNLHLWTMLLKSYHLFIVILLLQCRLNIEQLTFLFYDNIEEDKTVTRKSENHPYVSLGN